MNCELSRQRLLEQLDGAISGAAARDLERHLGTCESCRGFAADLAKIADMSASLAPIDPPEHVWLQLAGRWRREHGAATPAPIPFEPKPAAKRPRRWAFYGLAAAATLAMAVGGAWVAWNATAGTGDGGEVLLTRSDDAASSNANPTEAVLTAQKDIEAAERLYLSAIAGLERAAKDQASQLDPQIAKSIQTNLEVIDQAISESRAAAMAQPENPAWRTSLFDALKKKATLLQDTLSLVSEVSSGNQAGASRLSGTEP